MTDILDLEKQVGALRSELRDFQTSYREALQKKYDLDPITAGVIPLDTAKKMEEHARMLQRAVNTPREELERAVKAPRLNLGSQGASYVPQKNTASVVDAELAKKYRGPQRKGK